MDYLQTDEVGGIVAKGLAALYLDNPKFPIDYLAKWLLTYSKNLKLQQNRITIAETKKAKQELEKIRLSQLEVMQQQWQEIVAKMEQKHTDFIEKIKTTAYHDEFLQEQFCDYVTAKYKLNVYIAEMDFPTKEFNIQEEDDENAHINLEGTKLLTYIYANTEQQFLLGISLPPETGITYDVLKEPQPDENGEVQPNNGLYVPSVVKEPRIIYHKWPKLGSFYAIPFCYSSVLSEAAFDAGLESRQAYFLAKETQDKEKAAKEAEFEERLESEDPAIVEQDKQAYYAALEPVQETPLLSTKKELVLCLDTLGQDVEISEDDRSQLFNLSQLFTKSWEMKEIEVLQKDLDTHLALIRGLSIPYKELLEQFQLEDDGFVEGHQEKLAEFKENEKVYQFEVDLLRLEKLKDRLLDKDFIVPLLQLKDYRFIKFSGVIQAGLYLVNYDKKVLNYENTNKLNWRKVSQMWDETLINEILSYNPRGAKERPPFKWCLIERVQRKLEKIDQDAVDNYHLQLGRLLKFLNMCCKLRRMDVEIRRENIANKRKLLEAATEEMNKISELKEQLLREHLDQMPPEEQEEWNKEEWEANFEIEHPAPEIPENPVDEVDDDLE